jgi:hypothetical protein
MGALKTTWRRSHLREDGRPGADLPVQGLAPVLVAADAEAGDGRRLRQQLLELRARVQYHITRPLEPPYSLNTVLLKVESYNLLVEGHAPDEVAGAGLAMGG